MMRSYNHASGPESAHLSLASPHLGYEILDKGGEQSREVPRRSQLWSITNKSISAACRLLLGLGTSTSTKWTTLHNRNFF